MLKTHLVKEKENLKCYGPFIKFITKGQGTFTIYFTNKKTFQGSSMTFVFKINSQTRLLLQNGRKTVLKNSAVCSVYKKVISNLEVHVFVEFQKVNLKKEK